MRLGKDVIATDLYGVLGVPRNATEEQIRRAYRLQAMSSHPDLHGGSAEQRMVELNVAACILSDPARRAEYDRQRNRHRNHPPQHTERRDDWYPWGASTSAEDAPEWVPLVSPSSQPIDAETSVQVRRLRGGAEHSLHRLLDWSNTWPPGTHLAVTFASVCLALLLIASAKPTSLPGFQEQQPIACAEDGWF
jgi:curved DNA-binding protein CbpA